MIYTHDSLFSKQPVVGGTAVKPSVLLFAVARASHDVNREDSTLVPRQKIIDKIADDRVRFVTKLRHYTANQGAAPAVPLQIDRAVKISRAVNFRPTMRASRLFGPDFNEAEFLLELRIAHNLAAQRPASARDHMDHRLHR